MTLREFLKFIGESEIGLDAEIHFENIEMRRYGEDAGEPYNDGTLWPAYSAYVDTEGRVVLSISDGMESEQAAPSEEAT